jgi:hypothetical protein
MPSTATPATKSLARVQHETSGVEAVERTQTQTNDTVERATPEG